MDTLLNLTDNLLPLRHVDNYRDTNATNFIQPTDKALVICLVPFCRFTPSNTKDDLSRSTAAFEITDVCFPRAQDQ